MADKNAGKEGKDFTPREMEIMAKAWNCFVDYNKLATECGMSNPRSASNAWASIKKKIMFKAGNTTSTNGASGTADDGNNSAVKATPGKKRGKAKASTEDDAEEDESPTKKTRGRKAKGGEKKADSVVQADEEEENSGIPVKGEPFGFEGFY
ncbi:hypothetical protein LTR62_006124 [Meristemomyces frigidus]|uniref:Myb-like domain-containing protein n=1 Tax=Meristemomyces frigidus TaxID=1508187 RepID=A0AAN7YET3_9PEZI|nr:hypothetical protein LTR62_006124 [Meristemomyces frigidus]